jgi:hypothetical protein
MQMYESPLGRQAALEQGIAGVPLVYVSACPSDIVTNPGETKVGLPDGQ